MSDGSKLVRLIRQASELPENDIADILYGTVTSTSPLNIKVGAFTLTPEFLIVSPMCKAKTIDLTPNELGVIIIWRGLIVGDTVQLLKCGRGQKYYVLQREGQL